MPKGAQADTAGLALSLAVNGYFHEYTPDTEVQVAATPAEQVADVYVPSSYVHISLATGSWR